MEYWPEVVQAIPTDNYKVYVYFDDGTIKLFDATTLVSKGIFQQLTQDNLFIDTCTVLNGTLAWTPDKSYDATACLDVDPFVIYETCESVPEPTELFVTKG